MNLIEPYHSKKKISNNVVYDLSVNRYVRIYLIDDHVVVFRERDKRLLWFAKRQPSLTEIYDLFEELI